MRSKTWKEILPLLASCTILLVMGIVFFSLTKADAALLDEQIAPPTGAETTVVPAETTATDVIVKDDAAAAERKITSEMTATIYDSPYFIIIISLLIALLLAWALGGMIVHWRNHHGGNF